MAYYLSKRNREIILLLRDKLKEATDNVEIETPDPNGLAAIIRSAGNTQEFSWIKDKFTIRSRERSIVLKYRTSVNVYGSNSFSSKDSKERIKESNFFDIIQHLITNKPIKEVYKNNLDESDLTKLHLYCNKNNYTIELNEDTITFIKSIKE